MKTILFIDKYCSSCDSTKYVSDFYADRNKCKKCISLQRAKHYKKHKKRICKKASEYRKKHSERYKYDPEYGINWRKANFDNIIIYRQINKDSIKVQRADYYQRNKKTIIASTKEYQKKNPEIVRANKAKRHAAKLMRTMVWADLNKIKQIYADCAEINLAAKTAGCNETFHVDHIIPLQGKLVSGLHVENNLQIISATENLTKHNMFIPGSL